MTGQTIVTLVIFGGALVWCVLYLKRQNDRQIAEQARKDAAIRVAEQWYRRETGFAGELETSAIFLPGDTRWYVALESDALVGRDSAQVVVKEDNAVDASHWRGAQIAERWFRDTHRLAETDMIYLDGEFDPVDGIWTFLLDADSHALHSEVRIGRDGSVAVLSDEDGAAE